MRKGSGLGDRIIGAVVVVFALLLWFVVIPDQVDKVDYGWMRPATLPGICTVAMGLFGGLLMVLPGRGGPAVDRRHLARVTGLVALVCAALWAILQIGFVWIAPPLALGLALLLGERRWPWILCAAAGMPLLIWLVVDVLLNRSLP